MCWVLSKGMSLACLTSFARQYARHPAIIGALAVSGTIVALTSVSARSSIAGNLQDVPRWIWAVFINWGAMNAAYSPAQ